MALGCKAGVGSLFLVDRDSVGVAVLFPVVSALLPAKDFREEPDAAGPVEGVQEDQVGHTLRVEVEEPFTNLVGFEEDGTIGGPSSEEPECGLVQRVPAVFERATELVQGGVGGDTELDILEFRPIQEGDFKEAWLGFDD